MGSQPKTNKTLPGRGSALDQFPGKLWDLITFAEQKGLSDIVCWVPNGSAIMVHDPDRLLKILPSFGLSQTKYRSFERQLNMWHWVRILKGPYKGGWAHPYFIRGNRSLCDSMSRYCSPERFMLPVKSFVLAAAQRRLPTIAEPLSHFERTSQTLDFPMRKNKYSPSTQSNAPPCSSSLKSLVPITDIMCDDAPGWQGLFEAFCTEEEGGVTTQYNGSSLFDSQRYNFPIDYTIAPTPMAEHELIIEPTPLRDDRLPNCGADPWLTEPLSMETITGFFNNYQNDGSLQGCQCTCS